MTACDSVDELHYPASPQKMSYIGVLEQLVLESHVIFGLQSDASTEDIGQSCTLLAEGIDDGCAGWCHGCLFMLAYSLHGATLLP